LAAGNSYHQEGEEGVVEAMDPEEAAEFESMVAAGQAKATEQGSKLVVSAAREGAEFVLK